MTAIKHGPCIDCGAPVTVRDDGTDGALLCRECSDALGPARGIVGALLVVAGFVVAVLAWWAR